MNIVKKLVLGLIALCVVLCVASFALPSKVHVERSTVIDASRCSIYAQLDDYRRFNAWSPWAKRDPKTKYTFTGPDIGTGSKMAWESDDPEVGIGSQSITDTKMCESVTTALDFGPEGLAKAAFTLAKEGDKTKVTWSLDLDLDGVMMRYMGLMFDGMIGPDYEAGLAGLKAIAEKLPKGDWEGLTFETVDAKSQPMAYVTTAPAAGAVAIGKEFAAAFAKVGQFMGATGVQGAGQPLSVTKSVDAKGAVVFDAGIPLQSRPSAEPADAGSDAPEGGAPVAPPDVHVGDTPGGKALKVVYKGAYTGIEGALHGVDAYCAARGIAKTDVQWCQYISDPGQTPEAELITHIYQGIE